MDEVVIQGSVGVTMRNTKLLGAAPLILGLLALAYGGFSYTKETEKASIGSIKIEVEEKHRVNVPLWAGVAAAVAGGVLLARKS